MLNFSPETIFHRAGRSVEVSTTSCTTHIVNLGKYAFFQPEIDDFDFSAIVILIGFRVRYWNKRMCG